jgi:hypothetical protein
MKNSIKTIAKLMIAASALASLSAQAVLVTFDYQSGIQAGSNNNVAYGKTSKRINNDNTANTPSATGAGYYVETFDGNTTVGVPRVNASQKCGLSTLFATDITVDQGSYSLQKGSTGNGAKPAGDETCYAFGPGPGREAGTNAKITVDYAGFLAANPGKLKISYLGLYYGSIDRYNDIAFYNGATLMTGGGGLLDDGVLTGSEILALLGGSSGDQVSDKSNVYVNLDFSGSENFTSYQFRTTGIAFELDNVVAGIIDIPEPASVLLFSLGLLGLAGLRRKA